MSLFASSTQPSVGKRHKIQNEKSNELSNRETISFSHFSNFFLLIVLWNERHKKGQNRTQKKSSHMYTRTRTARPMCESADKLFRQASQALLGKSEANVFVFFFASLSPLGDAILRHVAKVERATSFFFGKVEPFTYRRLISG